VHIRLRARLPPVAVVWSFVGTWRDDAEMTSDEDRIRGIVASSPWLMRVLATAASSGLPDAWVGAGVLRDLVWGQLYGPGFTPAQVHDVDVVFLDGCARRVQRSRQRTPNPSTAKPRAAATAGRRSARTDALHPVRASGRPGRCQARRPAEGWPERLANGFASASERRGVIEGSTPLEKSVLKPRLSVRQFAP
jgi:Nucleotidyltransferase